MRRLDDPGPEPGTYHLQAAGGVHTPPLNRKRTRLMRVFVRVDGDVLKACYDGVEHTITTNPLHDSITFPGYGTFLRDDQIFG